MRAGRMLSMRGEIGERSWWSSKESGSPCKPFLRLAFAGDNSNVNRICSISFQPFADFGLGPGPFLQGDGIAIVGFLEIEQALAECVGVLRRGFVGNCLQDAPFELGPFLERDGAFLIGGMEIEELLGQGSLFRKELILHARFFGRVTL